MRKLWYTVEVKGSKGWQIHFEDSSKQLAVQRFSMEVDESKQSNEVYDVRLTAEFVEKMEV